MASLQSAMSLINNVSFAKGVVLRPSRKDIVAVAELLSEINLQQYTTKQLLYGPLPDTVKNTTSYKALYKKLESIPVLHMHDEPQRGGRRTHKQ